MSFGEKVRAFRVIRGLTLEALAKAIGSHKGYVSSIENRKVNPPSAKITKKLCKVLGLDYEPMLMLAWAEKAPKDVRQRALELVTQ